MNTKTFLSPYHSGAILGTEDKRRNSLIKDAPSTHHLENYKGFRSSVPGMGQIPNKCLL